MIGNEPNPRDWKIVAGRPHVFEATSRPSVQFDFAPWNGASRFPPNVGPHFPTLSIARFQTALLTIWNMRCLSTQSLAHPPGCY